MIYLDNAATTWPKPEAVVDAMAAFLTHPGANPGRSGHALSIQASRVVYDTRERIARRFGLDGPMAVAFTKNATEAINLALLGLATPGDHVVASAMEHNAVARPLRQMEQRGIAVTRVRCATDGTLDPDDVVRALRPETRIVVLTHASNVVGTLLPVGEIGRRLVDRDVLFLVDTAQTAGAIPIDMARMGIDLLAFTGHKALYGPTGTGGLCVGPRARGRLRPLIRGGTGSRSDSDEHPDFLPDCFEAGTLNTVGIAGLSAALDFLEARGEAAIRAHEVALTAHLIAGLRTVPRVRVHGTGDASRQTAVVSFDIAGMHCAEVAQSLEDRAGILCRAGLHCAPLAHRQIGTFPEGTVRFGMSLFNNEDEIDTAIEAVREIAATAAGG